MKPCLETQNKALSELALRFSEIALRNVFHAKPVNLSQNAPGRGKTLFDLVRFKVGYRSIRNSAS